MYLKATQISIQADENGLEMWIDTDEHDTIGFNIQDLKLLDVFYEQVRAQVLPYLREADEARRTLPVAYIDASGAYDLTDPKHPEYHSVMADLWDSREGK